MKMRGFSVKVSVKAGTNHPIELSLPLKILDDIKLCKGDRILVKNQVDAVQNGIYTVCKHGYLKRAKDYSIDDRVEMTVTFVTQGTVNAESGFVCLGKMGIQYDNDNPQKVAVYVGQDPLKFVKFSSNLYEELLRSGMITN